MSHPAPDLNDKILAAHAMGDEARLATLYAQAAQAADDETAKGFFLTHAYIFALSSGAPVAASLNAQLTAMGRDLPEPDPFRASAEKQAGK